VFHRLLDDARFLGKPMVLETPKPEAVCDAANVSVLRALWGTACVAERARRGCHQLRAQPSRAR
jgi:hypothetical protein